MKNGNYEKSNSPNPLFRSPFSNLHSPIFILHSTFSILHSSLFILHSSCFTLHSPFLIPHSPFPILHSLFSNLFISRKTKKRVLGISDFQIFSFRGKRKNEKTSFGNFRFSNLFILRKTKKRKNEIWQFASTKYLGEIRPAKAKKKPRAGKKKIAPHTNSINSTCSCITTQYFLYSLVRIISRVHAKIKTVSRTIKRICHPFVYQMCSWPRIPRCRKTLAHENRTVSKIMDFSRIFIFFGCATNVSYVGRMWIVCGPYVYRM